MRYTLNVSDEQAFRRVVNLPKRGIGPTTVDKIIVHGLRARHFYLGRCLSTLTSSFRAGRPNALLQFKDAITSFRLEAERQDAFEAASHIAKGSGLLREFIRRQNH